MRLALRTTRTGLLATAAVSALAITATGALAGGFEVREQSAYFQGLSFAGEAAGGRSLSAIFWNPAASSFVGRGVTTESNYSLILPQADIDITGVGAPGAGLAGCAVFDCSVDMGKDAVVPATYLAWRFDEKTVLSLALNSQFGLATKPDNPNWFGQAYARGSKLFSLNVNPSVSYEIMPGITLGAGVQVQYFDLKRFKTATGFPPGPDPTATLEGEDLNVGFTAGINIKPAPGTNIGLGYRSSIDHSLEGTFNIAGFPVPGVLPQSIKADVETPDKATLSIIQDLSSNMRLMGTVEWTNWSKLGIIPVTPQPIDPVFFPLAINLDFQWHDGWLFALGGEYDVNSNLTVRAGGAYEISPIQNPSERLVQLPDADRIWASIGASYKWNDSMSFDFAYSHVFVEDSSLVRTNSTGTAPLLFADVDSSVDIVSVGMKMVLPPLE